MKTKKLLIEESISPLSKTDENLLRGGFGGVQTLCLSEEAKTNTGCINNPKCKKKTNDNCGANCQ